MKFNPWVLALASAIVGTVATCGIYAVNVSNSLDALRKAGN